MSYILIPQIVSSSTAMIWVGAVDEKVRTKSISMSYTELSPDEKELQTQYFHLNPSEWRTWKTRHALDRSTSRKAQIQVMYYQRVTIGLNEPLKPRTEYRLKLIVNDESARRHEEAVFSDYSKAIQPDGAVVDVEGEKATTRARVKTLPEQIPAPPEKPLTVLLGSCFYRENDPDGLVGKTYINMPPEKKPEIKFLCGDQVYLDNPWMKTTFNIGLSVGAPEKMRNIFFQHYLKNWTQITTAPDGTPTGGFNLLLRNGANYFCSDDHEFWNNAPNFGGVAGVLTALRMQREWWFKESAELFRVFQSLAPWMTFDVPPVSFCIADTRINRLTGKKQFMEEDDLDAIGYWIQNLKGPGVLVLGQLLMEKKSSALSLFDFNLPDFSRQYEKLLGFIKESNHTIVALSGDVHFGRIAVCDLDAAKKTKFIEVISSPMYVVSNWRNKARVGNFKEAPEIFGTKVENFKVADLKNHFVTLEFARAASGKVNMTVNAWEILSKEDSGPPAGRKIGIFEL